MASSGKKSSKSEGSAKLPTKKVKHVKGGDSIQKATNRAGKGKNSY